MTDLLENTFAVARDVASIVDEAGLRPVVIGAMALAVHNYVRATDDLDFAVAAEPARVRALIPLFEARGWQVEWGEPDPDDPLGGVLTIQAPDALPIQIVNFMD